MEPLAEPQVGTAFLARDPSLDRLGAGFDQWAWWRPLGLRAPESSGRMVDPCHAVQGLATAGARLVAVVVEWARAAPAPGATDRSVLGAYRRVLAEAAEAGLDPVVVLHHRSHPGWMGDELWLTPGAPDRFAAHTDRVLEAVADLCRHWVTLTEVTELAVAGWVTGRRPPCRRAALSDAAAVFDNLLTAHVLAEDRIRRARPDALVLVGQPATGSYELGPLALDVLCRRSFPGAGVDLDGWLAERRSLHHRHHRATPAERVARALSGLLSPQGPPSPARRRCPGRVLREDPGAGRGPDGALVSWGRCSRQALGAWARAETALGRWRRGGPVGETGEGDGAGQGDGAGRGDGAGGRDGAGEGHVLWLLGPAGPAMLPEPVVDAQAVVAGSGLPVSAWLHPTTSSLALHLPLAAA